MDAIKVRPPTPVFGGFSRNDVVKEAKDDNLEKRLLE